MRRPNPMCSFGCRQPFMCSASPFVARPFAPQDYFGTLRRPFSIDAVEKDASDKDADPIGWLGEGVRLVKVLQTVVQADSDDSDDSDEEYVVASSDVPVDEMRVAADLPATSIPRGMLSTLKVPLQEPTSSPHTPLQESRLEKTATVSTECSAGYLPAVFSSGTIPDGTEEVCDECAPNAESDMTPAPNKELGNVAAEDGTSSCGDVFHSSRSDHPTVPDKDMPVAPRVAFGAARAHWLPDHKATSSSVASPVPRRAEVECVVGQSMTVKSSWRPQTPPGGEEKPPEWLSRSSDDATGAGDMRGHFFIEGEVSPDCDKLLLPAVSAVTAADGEVCVADTCIIGVAERSSVDDVGGASESAQEERWEDDRYPGLKHISCYVDAESDVEEDFANKIQGNAQVAMKIIASGISKLAEEGAESVSNGEFDGFASAGERAAAQFVAFAEQAVEQSSTDLARVADKWKQKWNPTATAAKGKAQSLAEQFRQNVTALLAETDEY